MVRVRATVEPDGTVAARRADTGEVLVTRVGLDWVRRTTEAELTQHAAEDDAAALRDAAAYARRRWRWRHWIETSC
jgi:hypothetical protein